jgi:hypothetical protein
VWPWGPLSSPSASAATSCSRSAPGQQTPRRRRSHKLNRSHGSDRSRRLDRVAPPAAWPLIACQMTAETNSNLAALRDPATALLPPRRCRMAAMTGTARASSARNCFPGHRESGRVDLRRDRSITPRAEMFSGQTNAESSMAGSSPSWAASVSADRGSWRRERRGGNGPGATLAGGQDVRAGAIAVSLRTRRGR